jgi:Uma2 family endonuclease
MNTRLDLKLEKRAFLQWAEGREGHFELKGNRVVMMTGGTKGHAFVTQEITYALRRRLDPVVWRVTAADLAVAIGEDIRYPDIVVEPASSEWSALSTECPVFLAEVLSPSSLALDFRDKAAEYMSLPSLEAYLVAAQDEPRMWLWQRPAPGDHKRPFPASPQEFEGLDATLSLTAFGVTMQLAEIYARIVASR